MFGRFFLFVFSCGVAFSAVPEEPFSVETAAESLGSGSYAERRAAGSRLWELGTTALPLLEELVKSADPEVAFRARDLKKKIRYGMTPDTPAAVVALVESYPGLSLQEKEHALLELRSLEADRQALFLYASEIELEAKEALREAISGAARAAARTAMANNRDQDVFELLMMDPAEGEGFAALASYYKNRGLLERELAKAASPTTRKGKRWQLALAQEAGQYDLGKTLAKELGNDYAYGAMSLMQGDPVPLMTYIHEAKKELEPNRTDVTNAHEELSLARWTGAAQIPLTMNLVELARKNKGRESIADAVIASLALNGETEMVEQLMQVHMRDEYVALLERQSRLEELFELTGFKNTPADRKAMSRTLVEFAGVNRGFGGVGIDRAFNMASLLGAHGDFEGAREILDESMELLWKKNRATWKRWVQLLFSSNQNFQLAEYYILQAIGEKEELPLAVIEALQFNGRPAVKGVILKLQKVNGLVAWKQMAMLRGLYPESGNEIDEIESQLLELAETDEDRLLVAGFALSRLRNDEESIEKISKSLVDPEKSLNFSSINLARALNHQNWDKAEGMLQALLKVEQTPGLLVQLFYVQEGKGDHEAASQTKKQLEDSFLADPETLSDVAEYAIRYGKTDYATQLLSKALSVPEFSVADLVSKEHLHTRFYLLGESARKEGLWARAAACYELFSFLAFNDPESNASRPIVATQIGGYISLCRAMDAMEKGRMDDVLPFLRKTVKQWKGSGKLSDDFFPLVRGKVHPDLYAAWFRESYEPLAKVLADFPRAHNVHNTAAWLASRAVMILDEAEEHSRISLEMVPNHAAYLDTMAEVHFAKGDREKALEFSRNALGREGLADMMWEQYRHFRDDPFPQ